MVNPSSPYLPARSQDKIANFGGIEVVVDAARRHRSDAEVVRMACRAMFSLANCNDSNKEKIANLGGIEVLVDAARRHRLNAEVVCWACRAMVDLAFRNASN